MNRTPRRGGLMRAIMGLVRLLWRPYAAQWDLVWGDHGPVGSDSLAPLWRVWEKEVLFR